MVLVGMMAVGKTTVGNKVAKLLGRPFHDADDELVRRTGRTVAEWFTAEGEEGFRAVEAEVLAALLDDPVPSVVALGGGAVTVASNRARLRDPDRAVVVWLEADAAFLAARAKRKSHRPLLAEGDPLATLTRLCTQREPWYREVADVVLPVAPVYRDADKPKRDLARMVVDAVAAYGILVP